MSRLSKRLIVVTLALSLLAVPVASGARAACAYDAQIAAQQGAIATLQAQLVGADPRTAAVLNVQIAARQAAVADLQAACQ